MIGWLVSLRDRPIAESERHVALVAILALLVMAAVLLVLTRPSGGVPRHHAHHAAVASLVQSSQAAPAGGALAGTPLSGAVVRASRGFLAGYLAYLYGHAPASRIEDATPSLIASLVTNQPRVSPAMREHHARIVELQAAAPAPAAGLLCVRALINDGGLVDYPIVLVLEDEGDGRLLVSGLEGER